MLPDLLFVPVLVVYVAILTALFIYGVNFVYLTIVALRTQDRRQLEGRLQQSEMRMLMQMDKANYDTQAASNPVYRRMASEVERVFQEQVRKGQPVERQVILENLIGKQALNGAANSGTQRRAARKRVEQERVAPSSNRSSTTVQSRKVSTAEERLKDVLI